MFLPNRKPFIWKNDLGFSRGEGFCKKKTDKILGLVGFLFSVVFELLFLLTKLFC